MKTFSEVITDPYFRLMVLELALISLEKDNHYTNDLSICRNIRRAVRHVLFIQSINTDDKMRVGTTLSFFPEIMRYKPEHSFLQYWFPKNDYDSRLNIMKLAIDELKTKINNL